MWTIRCARRAERSTCGTATAGSGSGGRRRVVEVLRVGAEVRAEHEAGVDHPENLVAETVDGVLHAGGRALVEVEEPRAAARAPGHVALHAEVVAGQEIVDHR